MIANNKLFYTCAVCSFLTSYSAKASLLETNVALMQAMDKITGKVTEVVVPVGGEAKFKSFSIVLRACKKTPPEETPENYAFVDITDNHSTEKEVNIFKGWMMSSTPSLNGLEHPIYDVWLLECQNRKGKLNLLTAEELSLRDQIVQKIETNTTDITKKVKESLAKVEEIEVVEVGEFLKSEDPTTEAVEDKSIAEEKEVKTDAVSELEAVPDEPKIAHTEQTDPESNAPKSLINFGNDDALDDVSEEDVVEEDTILIDEDANETKDDNSDTEESDDDMLKELLNTKAVKENIIKVESDITNEIKDDDIKDEDKNQLIDFSKFLIDEDEDALEIKNDTLKTN